MERGGSGPQATVGAPQLRSPPVYGTSPILRCHITSDLVVIAYCFLLRVGEYTMTTPCRGQHKRTLKGGHHILAPDKGDPHGLTPGTPPPTRWGHCKPGQPEEQSEGCQSISHPIGGSNHMPMHIFGQIGGRAFRPPRQHCTRNLLHCNRNFPGYRPGDSGGSPPRGEVGQPPPFSRVRLCPHWHPLPPFRRGHQAMPGRFQQGCDPTHGPVVLRHLLKIHPAPNSPTSGWSSSLNGPAPAIPVGRS
jgi:hypothetical protein